MKNESRRLACRMLQMAMGDIGRLHFRAEDDPPLRDHELEALGHATAMLAALHEELMNTIGEAE